MARGSNGAERLVGIAAPEILDGGKGDDTISGLGGNDTLYGGSDDDELHGGDGDDVLFGGSGDNTLYGGAGNDVYYAENKAEDEYYDLGGGEDTLRAENTGKNFTFSVAEDFTKGSGTGIDLIDGGAGNKTVVIKGADKNAAVDFDFSEITLENID